MGDALKFSQNAFSNWPEFVKELRGLLAARLDRDAVDRVMAKTREAYSGLLPANLTSQLDPERAEHVRRFEAWNKDFQSTQMKMLSQLIDSFVALETRSDAS